MRMSHKEEKLTASGRSVGQMPVMSRGAASGPGSSSSYDCAKNEKGQRYTLDLSLLTGNTARRKKKKKKERKERDESETSRKERLETDKKEEKEDSERENKDDDGDNESIYDTPEVLRSDEASDQQHVTTPPKGDNENMDDTPEVIRSDEVSEQQHALTPPRGGRKRNLSNSPEEKKSLRRQKKTELFNANRNISGNESSNESPSDETDSEIEQPRESNKEKTIPEIVFKQVKTIKSCLVKKGSEDAHEALDILQCLILSLVEGTSELKGQIKALERIKAIEPQISKESYSNVASKIVGPKLPKAVYIHQHKSETKLAIKPRDISKFENLEAAKANFERTFCPRREKVKIRNIRKTRNGIILETADEESAKKVLDNTALKKNFNIEILKKQQPKVIMYDVPKDLTSDEMNTIFEEQGISGNEVSLKFKTGPKQGDKCHWVFEVTPSTRKVMLNKKRIFIDYSSCKIADYVLVTRCFKCLGYGHISKHCEKKETCSNCAQEGHTGKNCQKKNEKRRCINCIKARKKEDHHVFDTKCPCYIKALENLVNNTDYGE